MFYYLIAVPLNESNIDAWFPVTTSSTRPLPFLDSVANGRPVSESTHESATRQFENGNGENSDDGSTSSWHSPSRDPETAAGDDTDDQVFLAVLFGTTSIFVLCLVAVAGVMYCLVRRRHGPGRSRRHRTIFGGGARRRPRPGDGSGSKAAATFYAELTSATSGTSQPSSTSSSPLQRLVGGGDGSPPETGGEYDGVVGRTVWSKHAGSDVIYTYVPSTAVNGFDASRKGRNLSTVVDDDDYDVDEMKHPIGG